MAFIYNNITWQNFSVIMFSSKNDMVTEINYKKITDNTHYHGVQQDPIALIRGKNTYSGSISMYEESWIAISKASNGNPQSIAPFEIAITIEPTEDSPTDGVFTDTLYNCVFSEDGFTTKQGETSNIVTIPFIFFSWNKFS